MMKVVNLLELPTSYIIGGAAVIIAVLLFIVWVRRSPGTLNTTYPLSRGSRGGPMFGNTKKPQIATPATLNAQNVHVSGAVKGEITAVEQLEISPTGKVWGDITTAALHIEPGGLFRGQSAMSTNIDEPLLLEAPRASRAE